MYAKFVWSLCNLINCEQIRHHFSMRFPASPSSRHQFFGVTDYENIIRGLHIANCVISRNNIANELKYYIFNKTSNIIMKFRLMLFQNGRVLDI